MKSFDASTIRQGRIWSAAWLLIVLVGLSSWSRSVLIELIAPHPWLREYNITPPTASSGPARTESARQRRVLMMDAPSQLDWALTGNEREFEFSYGYLPRAVAEGKSNGADVIVELVRDGAAVPLAQRHLDPLRTAADRGEQSMHLVLPPFPPGSRLILKFGPGDGGDNAWDWLYVADAWFTRAPHYLPSQFPAFNRAPDAIESSHTYPYQRDGLVSLLQANAPARLMFTLTGAEKHVHVGFGFFAGAYTNGNATDGVRVSVAVKSGPTTTVVGERFLNPTSVAADRGPQALDLALPAVTRNSQLIVTIDPGGSSSWDWTYLSGLTLE